MGEEHEAGAETQPGGLSRKTQLHAGTEPPGRHGRILLQQQS